jgi:uncharacterized protein YecE (DUF72 family)
VRRKSPHPDQLSLFGPAEAPPPRSKVQPAPVAEEHARLGERVPAGLWVGTSTWSFPGWAGILWRRKHGTSLLAREGLGAYAAHPLLTGVGLDRTYYQPLAAPEYAAYAAQVPEGFRFVVKAHEALTVSHWPDRERYGSRRGEENPLFLDPAYAAEEVVGPTVEGLGERLGPLVFQFAPQDVGAPLAFIERLFAFLDALPTGPLYAVEVRNRELLVPQYALALADAGVSPCLTVHPRMPPLPEQWRATARVALAERPALVLRWMLRPGQTYDGARARYEPFDRLVDPDPDHRAVIADLARRALGEELPVFITVNNKAEGSAPLSVFELIREIVGGKDDRL